jgi:hypothetical protein
VSIHNCAVDTLIKKADNNKATEPMLMKYFKELDNPAVHAFIKHLTSQNCKEAFLNHFTYVSHEGSTKRLHPSFANRYRSLVLDPNASLLKDKKQ